MMPVSSSPYSITAVYGGNTDNLGSTSNVVNQTIAPAPLTITANNQSMTYGGTMPALSISYSGLVNGDTSATFATSPNTPPDASTVPATSNAGSYPITVTGAYDPNYVISYEYGTLMINKASATIVVTPYSVTYDGNTHTATGTATGVESPNPSNLSSLLNLSGTTHTIAGSYTDTWTFAGNVNYASASGNITDFIAQPPLSVKSIGTVSPNPRNSSVSSIDVTFSEPINTSSVASGALTLTDDGGANLINSSVSLSLVSGDTYAIGSLFALTTAQGKYTLTVNSADIKDQNGLPGFGALSTSWLMDATAPASHVVNSLGTNQTSDTFPVSVSFGDPTGPGAAPASGVSAVELWVSVNDGAFFLYQTMNTPTPSGSVIFTFVGQDRNTYAFHSIAIDAAGNTESKNNNAIEASTSVPDLNPPVTHVLTSSSFNSNNGVFTLNWSGTDPDQNSGTPAGSVAVVDVYVEIDGGTPTLIGQESGGTPVGGVYSGSLTYSALADNATHTYGFYSIGIDDEQKAQAQPSSPDVTFTEKYQAALAVSNLVVEKGIAERSFIEYLDVDFNQTASTSTALSKPGDRARRRPAPLTRNIWNSCGTARVHLPRVYPREASTCSVPAPRRL